MEEFLASHSGSLRTFCRTALLFRLFVLDFIDGPHIDMPSTLREVDNDDVDISPSNSNHIRGQ